jgi:hypothetical protein
MAKDRANVSTSLHRNPTTILGNPREAPSPPPVHAPPMNYSNHDCRIRPGLRKAHTVRKPNSKLLTGDSTLIADSNHRMLKAAKNRSTPSALRAP